jgi:hypothetical protein
MTKIHVMYLDNYKHLLQQVSKTIVPKFIHMKKMFLGKIYIVLFYNNHVSSLYLVCTHNVNGGCILEDCCTGV